MAKDENGNEEFHLPDSVAEGLEQVAISAVASGVATLYRAFRAQDLSKTESIQLTMAYMKTLGELQGDGD